MLARTLPFVVALVIGGCATDTVGTDTNIGAICGNGKLETGEECDVDSDGCANCQVTAGWSCNNNICAVICGDGVVGTGPDCKDPQRDTDCDLTGYWAEREADWSRDAVVNSLQAQTDWHLYRIEQQGDNFTIAEGIDCGLLVTGAATVEFSPATLRGLIWINRMDGQVDPADGGVAHPARKGTSKASDGGCAVTMERHYIQRGLDDSWLPSDFNAGVALSDMPALPKVTDPVAGNEWPPGATDTDGDGIPGAAFQVTGIIVGTRNSVQRQWRQYATDPGQPVPAHAIQIKVPGDYDLQENVLRVSNCGTGCALLASGSHTGNDIRPYVVMSFLGRTLGSPSVSAVGDEGDAPRHGR